ncbi:MAG: hypothetical protein NTU41_00675, partial [Chloroflexi bacterium]|nr:hypothetical protein [Chloroflexota bacterium]
SSSLETRRMLGVSWWRFLAGGLRMRQAYGGSFSELGNLAAGAIRVNRAFLEGDVDFGAVPGGQVSARIDDIPTARQVIERVVAEARAIVGPVAEKVQS